VIVVDASAALAALLHAGRLRTLLSEQQLHVPHLADLEVASGLRRLVLARAVTAAQGWAALASWRQMGVYRHPATTLLERVWELRNSLSAYDASYVALAEGLGCGLVTADGRLGRAPGVRCPITLVPG
jgi:predicted nucleic acid-binding protein